MTIYKKYSSINNLTNVEILSHLKSCAVVGNLNGSIFLDINYLHVLGENTFEPCLCGLL